MKFFVLSVACWCGLMSTSAQQAHDPAQTVEIIEGRSPSPGPAAAWSVLGTWNTVHQHWAKPITISANGRFFVDHGDHKDFGRWKLVAEGAHINLVLGWDGWDPETVTLIGANEFRGDVPTGKMILRRDAVASSPGMASGPNRISPNVPPTPAVSSGVSPCGSWIWQHDAVTNVIKADGTVAHGSDQGTWHWVDQANHKLQIDWKSGFVDTATIAPDGRTMKVVNNADDEFIVRRIKPLADEP